MLIKECSQKGQEVDWKILLFVCILSFAIVSLHVASLPSSVYWWTPDSSAYIEAARSFLKTGEFLASPRTLFSDSNYEPLKLWPPGYPLLIALFSMVTGTSVEAASYVISLISWFLLAPAIVYTVTPVVGRPAAIWTAIIASLSPGVITWGWVGITDLPFLTIAVFCLGFLARSYDGRNCLIYAFSAGIFAGLAYAFRNIGLALFGASVVAYVSTTILGSLQKKDITFRLIAFCLGAAVFVLPLIWFNISTFGSLQPYHMDPSTVSLTINARSFAESIISDVSGLTTFSNFIAWTWWALLLCLEFTLFWGGLAIRQAVAKNANHRVFDWSERRIFAAGALLLYVLFGTVLVISARTIYEWGEMISVRHTLQYTWALLAILFATSSLLVNRRKASFATLVLGISLLLGHSYWSWENHWSSNSSGQRLNPKTEIYNNDSLAKRLVELPNDTILFSNHADVLRIKIQQPIRSISPHETSKAAAKLAELKTSRIWSKNIAVILFAYPEGQVFNQNQMNEFASLGFSVERIDERVLVLVKPTIFR